MTNDRRDLTPRIEHRAVDHVKTVTCPHRGRDVEPPREEPWKIGRAHV